MSELPPPITPEQEEMIEELAELPDLTTFERSFIESIGNQDYSLTPTQADLLTNIYERKTRR